MVNRFFVRIVALCAACMLPTLALARNHDSGGFYIGVGAHTNGAELDFTRDFTASVTITGLFTAIHTVSGGGATTTISGTYEAVEDGSVTVSSDEDSDFGYGVHVGYKINEFFSVEVSYADLGEFSGKSQVELPGDEIDGTDFNDIEGTISHFVDASAFSGAVLGSYALADNASVFGRLGYYSTDISESISFAGTGGTGTGTATVALPVRLSSPLLEDASGLLYGAGVELAFGGNRNILVRGEFNVLADGLGEIDDITQFGLTAAWKF